MPQSTMPHRAGRNNPDRWGLRLPNLKRRFVPRDLPRSSSSGPRVRWPSGGSPLKPA